MNVEIPDKLYFKIGEVGKLADVPTHVLRYWESEFSVIKPKRANSKQRLYRRQDVELILQIKNLLHEQGYTIAGARKLLESGEEIPLAQASSAPFTDNGTAVQKLGEVKDELHQLKQFIQKIK
jgi:DNA-binding transcriptional MerR regulator